MSIAKTKDEMKAFINLSSNIIVEIKNLIDKLEDSPKWNQQEILVLLKKSNLVEAEAKNSVKSDKTDFISRLSNQSQSRIKKHLTQINEKEEVLSDDEEFSDNETKTKKVSFENINQGIPSGKAKVKPDNVTTGDVLNDSSE